MLNSNYSLFMNVWPWIGLGYAISIIILLFFTDFLHTDKSKSKWFDLSWIAWIGSIQYMIHNVEEYGIDFTGTILAFPEQMLKFSGTQVSELAYLGCNIPLIWFCGPIMAVLSKKYKGCAVGMSTFAFFNALNHIVSFITQGYNPGLVTSICIFIPVFVWTVYVCIGKEKMHWSLIVKDLIASILYHGVLYGGIFLAKLGIIQGLGQALVMILDAVAIGYLWFLFGKKESIN